MSVALLDVNVLIALAWTSHIHHRAAHAWFRAHKVEGWATCATTQCGFVRVSSNPSIIPEAVRPIEAVDLLKRIVALPGHVFWTESLPLYDSPVPTGLLAGHRQVTDAYLLGLAIHHEGRLATLDRSIGALIPPEFPRRDLVAMIPIAGL